VPVLCVRVLCRGAYMYMLLGYVGATYLGANRGSAPPDRSRHTSASGLQPAHQPSCAIAVVAIAMPTASVSNAVVNLIIASILS
jgi:hypothetical protein